MSDVEIFEESRLEGHIPSASANSTPYAPWYDFYTRLVSIEHPYIISDVDKGIATVGGIKAIQELVRDSEEATAKLYLRPGNRMTKPIHSTNVRTNNVVLKITVPKRTGLKRRRGTQGPCYYEGLKDGNASPQKLASISTDAQSLFRSLQDNPKGYQVEAIGSIAHTHRFRAMPDFVSSTSNSPFIQKMKKHILPFDYEKMKGFKLDMSKGIKPNTEIIPPPRWSHMTIPFNYSYRQNPSVKTKIDKLGNKTTSNVHTAPKTRSQPVPFNGDIVPVGPSPELAPIESLDPALQRLIAGARSVLEERPIFTRRALQNCVPGNEWGIVGQNQTKLIYQYLGYTVGSGPWRDTLVRFGVDPRKDPSMRVYQTLMFVLDNEVKSRSVKKPKTPKTEQELQKKSHIFDGKTFSRDGKVWQVCDITDPLLKNILETSEIREECNVQSDGWYPNGTWAKTKQIMKHHIASLSAGVAPNDAAYQRIATDIPETILQNDLQAARLPLDAGSDALEIATGIRRAAFMHKEKELGGIGRGESGTGGDERVREAVSELDKLGGVGQDMDDLEEEDDGDMEGEGEDGDSSPEEVGDDEDSAMADADGSAEAEIEESPPDGS